MSGVEQIVFPFLTEFDEEQGFEDDGFAGDSDGGVLGEDGVVGDGGSVDEGEYF